MAFKFTIEKGIPIPEVRDSTSSHAFEWGEMEQGDSIPVTQDYWINERGMDPADYKIQKIKERIRIHFRNWQSKDKARSVFMLHMHVMKTPAEIEKYGEGAIRVWLDKPVSKATQEVAPPPPPAPEPEPAKAPAKAPAKKPAASARKPAAK